MTQDILVNTGEEYVTKNDLQGDSVDIGLYNDGTDGITDTDNLSAITTEPGNTNYSRQTDTVTVSNVNGAGDWGFENDSNIDFDFSDVQPGDAEDITLDTGFFVVNFQSTEAGDGSASDNLFGTFALTQDRNTGDIDTLRIEAGDAEFTID